MYLIHFLISLITFFYLAPKLSLYNQLNHLNQFNVNENLNLLKYSNFNDFYLKEKFINVNTKKSISFYVKSSLNYIEKFFLLSAKNYKTIQLWANLPVGASALSQDSRGYRTLRMFQTHACDNNNLELKCPKNSAISIYSAHFGSLKTAQDPDTLCPHINLESNKINNYESLNSNQNLTCSSIHAFMIVDTKCKDNQFCTVPATISQFLKQPNLTLVSEQEANKFKQSTEIMIDLCSSEVTYAEVAYKCKPTSITSKGICENEKLHLTCPKRQVIHIYKAFYGSINEPYIAQCKSIDKTTRDINDNLLNEEECPVNNETEMLIKLCQGYRKCNLIANDETFNKTQIDFSLMNNSICKKNKRLKVLYTCTMPQILTDEYQTRSKILDFSSTTSVPFSKTDDVKSNEESSSESTILDGYINHFEILSSPVPKASKEKGDSSEEFDESCNCTSINPKKSALGFVSEWIQVVFYMSGNQERLLLYFLVSILFALICILIVMSCRLRNGKKKIKRCMKQQLTSTLDYITNEEDENLMSVCNTPSHYKQLQRQNLMNNSLLNEANNNNFQRPFRNSENLILINNSEPTTFYSQAISQKINCTPNSHINPNYLHPFLNERELINTRSSYHEDDDDDEDDEEPLEGGFNRSNSATSNNDRQNLMVTTNKTFKPTTTKPILIKNYASTMHFARFNPNKHQNQKFNSMNRATIAAILTNTRSQPNFLLPSEDKTDEDNYLNLSSSPNLNPCQTFSTTSAGSHNTTLTTATTSLSSPSPKSLSLSQRATPPSNYRLRNQDSYSPLSHILITTLTTTLATTVETNSLSTFKNTTNTSQSPNKTLHFNTFPINSQNSLQNSPVKENKKNIKKLSLTSSISDQNIKKPAWLDQPSPVKTNDKQKDIIVFESNNQTITNLKEKN